MAQKIQFISAIIARPKLVILDEPFSGLDPVNMESLKEAVLSLREQGATVVFSTHDMDTAEKMCDTIFMIFQGKKVLDGTLDDIQAQYSNDRVRVHFSDIDSGLPPLRGVNDVQRVGRFFEFRLDRVDDSQRIVQELAAQRQLTHFQVVKPSLHDIFVRIAKPESTLSNGFSSET
jgi:ABC-2 type transport system ATP-binding protein